MATQGRKNVHGKAGVRFKAPYTASKDKSMVRNVVSELIVYGRVTVISTVAKQIQVQADKLVTLAKRGDLHARRLAASVVRPGIVETSTGVSALDKLFNEIGPEFKERNGGYTRVLKLVNRKGDNAPMAIVEFVR